MRKALVTTLLLAFSFCAASAQAVGKYEDENIEAADEMIEATAATHAEGTSYRNIDGTAQQLDILKPGAPTLAVFWASWCRSCLAEIPHIKKLQQDYPQLKVVGVNVNKDPEDGLRTQQEYQLSYASISDPDLKLADHFKVRGTPGFILLDAQGELKEKANRLSKKLKKAIVQILAADDHG